MKFIKDDASYALQHPDLIEKRRQLFSDKIRRYTEGTAQVSQPYSLLLINTAMVLHTSVNV